MTETEAREEKSSDDAPVCMICGKRMDRLYQQDTCKACLLLSFSKYVKLINDFREV
jgi:hypothetical protein